MLSYQIASTSSSSTAPINYPGLLTQSQINWGYVESTFTGQDETGYWIEVKKTRFRLDAHAPQRDV